MIILIGGADIGELGAVRMGNFWSKIGNFLTKNLKNRFFRIFEKIVGFWIFWRASRPRVSSSLRSEPVMEFWGSLRPRLARGARAESVLAKKLKNRCFIVFSKKSIFFWIFSRIPRPRVTSGARSEPIL